MSGLRLYDIICGKRGENMFNTDYEKLNILQKKVVDDIKNS